tara:strand:- start:7328 stop:8275 length:948 start_codon:yes stop_codon:yes gene_type:complete
MFSVIIPVYNKAPHLSRSINSVLNQSFQEFELILVDDGSTDGSKELLKDFRDPRISVFYRDIPGPGGYAARNLGVEKAKNNWIAFLDADDNWSSKYLSSVKNAIEYFPSEEIFSTAWCVQSKTGNKICPASKNFSLKSLNVIDLKNFLTDSLKNTPLVWTSTLTVKKDLISSVEGFPAGKCKSGGDIDTWLRLLLTKKSMVFINDVLGVYQTESVNMVTKSQKSFEIGCIMRTVKEEIQKGYDKEVVKLLKKYSNKYLFALIAKSIKAGKYDTRLSEWIYKESDPFKYLIIRLFKLKPFRVLYQKHLVNKADFYG